MVTFTPCHLTWKCRRRNAVSLKGLSQISDTNDITAGLICRLLSGCSLCRLALASLAPRAPLCCLLSLSLQNRTVSQLGQVFSVYSEQNSLEPGNREFATLDFLRKRYDCVYPDYICELLLA